MESSCQVVLKLANLWTCQNSQMIWKDKDVHLWYWGIVQLVKHLPYNPHKMWLDAQDLYKSRTHKWLHSQCSLQEDSRQKTKNSWLTIYIGAHHQRPCLKQCRRWWQVSMLSYDFHIWAVHIPAFIHISHNICIYTVKGNLLENIPYTPVLLVKIMMKASIDAEGRTDYSFYFFCVCLSITYFKRNNSQCYTSQKLLHYYLPNYKQILAQLIHCHLQRYIYWKVSLQ